MWANSKHKAVRLRHPTRRSCVWLVVLPSIRYPVPYDCHRCNQSHIFKTFHLDLNEHGEVAVHPDIYELFKANGIVGELRAMKEVTPRPHVIGMGLLDSQGVPIPTNAPTPEKTYVPPTTWKRPAVFSERGLVKE
jgi:hypothetical protein